jgi:hypothetical protein
MRFSPFLVTIILIISFFVFLSSRKSTTISRSSVHCHSARIFCIPKSDSCIVTSVFDWIDINQLDQSNLENYKIYFNDDESKKEFRICCKELQIAKAGSELIVEFDIHLITPENIHTIYRTAAIVQDNFGLCSSENDTKQLDMYHDKK